jgi:hypothetical protein
MLQLNSNNQIVLLYYYDNKKQTIIVLYSCHLNASVNHLGSTSTYTSYFILLLFVTKYYKSAVYVGGDSVKSDQTFINKILLNFKLKFSLKKFLQTIYFYENLAKHESSHETNLQNNFFGEAQLKF